MTTYICVKHSVDTTTEMFEGATLAAAAEKFFAARGVEVTADYVQPQGGTNYHIVYRDVNPDEFWMAQLSYAMGDDEEWGYGATAAEAAKMASPEYE